MATIRLGLDSGFWVLWWMVRMVSMLVVLWFLCCFLVSREGTHLFLRDKVIVDSSNVSTSCSFFVWVFELSSAILVVVCSCKSIQFGFFFAVVGILFGSGLVISKFLLVFSGFSSLFWHKLFLIFFFSKTTIIIIIITIIVQRSVSLLRGRHLVQFFGGNVWPVRNETIKWAVFPWDLFGFVYWFFW